MLVRILILAVSLLFPCAVYADAPSYKLIKYKSSLKFVAMNNNAPVEGQFKDFNADIKFNPDKPEESKIIVEVATGSVFASYDEVAKNLVSKDWFAVSDFHKAVFSSEKITRMPNSDNYYADGKLQLRDKTVPIVLNFEVKFTDGKNAIAKGFATIKRDDFGIGQGEWKKDDVLRNEVRVEFRVVAEKQ